MNPDLTEAVTALTKPTRTKVIRDDGSTVNVDHDALLVQLEDAITSATTGNGGGAGAPTAVLVNSEALYRAMLIGSQIADWCRIVGVKPVRSDLSLSLSRWLVAFQATNTDRQFYIQALRQWAVTIEELLDPPRRLPLVDPCVACGAKEYVTADGERLPYPVVVEYDRALLHASLRATCRACELVWTGPEAVDELVSEMKERHPETTRIVEE